MLTSAVTLLRRHGPFRLGRLVRDLMQSYGWRGGLAFVIGRLRNTHTGLVSPFGPGPVARLADVVAEPVGSRPFERGGLVLIANLDLPQCRKYRVVQKQDLLERALGRSIPIADYRNVHRWKTLLQTAGQAILYRIPAGTEFDALLAETRRLGVDLCYDIDDPVFDVETVRSNPNLGYLSKSIQRSLLADAVAFAAAMRQCRRITVSTMGLQALVRARFPQAACHVVPNGVDAESLHFGTVAVAGRTAARSPTFRILLPSGSLAHAADTRVAIEGVRRFVSERPNTELVTIGHFEADSPLRRHSRFKELPYMAYSDYMRVLGDADCALVPLVDAPFNAGKSIVRLIDATLARVPVIASPVGEYADPAIAGAYLPASTPDEWQAALRCLAEDRREGDALVRSAQRLVAEPRGLAVLWSRLDPELQAFCRADHAAAPLGLAA